MRARKSFEWGRSGDQKLYDTNELKTRSNKSEKWRHACTSVEIAYTNEQKADWKWWWRHLVVTKPWWNRKQARKNSGNKLKSYPTKKPVSQIINNSLQNASMQRKQPSYLENRKFASINYEKLGKFILAFMQYKQTYRGKPKFHSRKTCYPTTK